MLSAIPNGCGCTKWMWATFRISLIPVCVMVSMLQATPLPDDPLQAFGLAAMTALGTISEVMTNGGAIHRDSGFEIPFMKAHSKTDMGMGDAMRPRRADSDEDSDEDRRRKKRAVIAPSNSTFALESAEHPHEHRGKRSPCHGGSTGGGGSATTVDGGDDTETLEERRRRAQRKRKAAQQKQRSTKSKSRKKKLVERRRRQIEIDDLEGDSANDIGKKLSEHAQQFAQKVQQVMVGIAQMMKGVVQQMQQTFAGATQNAAGDM